MRIVDLLHRWSGGTIGLLLAILGLSGTILLHENLLVRLTAPHAADTQMPSDAAIASVLTRYLGDPASGVRSIRIAGEGVGVHRLAYKGEGGAYVDQAGEMVTRWTHVWQRPEVWLFDLHHHLFLGEIGTIVVGIAALFGVGFIVTGVILWWQTRKTFEARLWPKRMSRPAIVRHHRDLGIVAAPLLLLSCVTGAMMTLKPIEAAILAPFGSAHAPKATKVDRGDGQGGPKRPAPRVIADWGGIVAQARARFPDAAVRWVGLPTAKDPRVQLRMRQPGEWTPNGRTSLFFDSSGKLLETRDALLGPARMRVKNAEYPLHIGVALPWVGVWLLTLSGLALTMLGSLAVYSFWVKPLRLANA